ncbi:hypothetical protein L6452_41904 [Arctium lappa]|uniref:Uncharacterized protein n=1 Tax=Arctium lappa TaxID=4217 RepID=A0ACB8XH76_ARCLA|nr:hypothetical protein L6452_41904 [Arctium lappa]
MKIHSFSNITNTADNPLDEDGNEIVAKKEPPAANETKPSRRQLKGSSLSTNVISVGSSSTVRGTVQSTNVISVGSSSTVKCAGPSTNVVVLGSSSSSMVAMYGETLYESGITELKDAPPRTNDAITKTAKPTKDDGSIATSMNDLVNKIKVHPSRGDMRSSERKIDKSVDKRVVKTENKPHNKALDTNEMALALKDGPIPITVELIHELLGLLVGGIDLLSEEPVSPVENITKSFKTQFDKTKMRPRDVQKLIQESTECENMRVEHMRPATLGWSFESLKKRESSELDAGGLGSATMKPLSRQTSMGIGTDNYDIKYGSSGTEDFGGPSNTTNVAEDEDTSRALVLSQNHDNQVSQFWFTPTLHMVCDEAYSKSIVNKKGRREVEVVPPPQFDIETSPLNDVKPLTAVKAVRKDKGKGVCLEDEGPLKKAKPLDESYHEFAANEPGQVVVISTRRSIRLGDHHRSPYVRRVVDMKVSTEDKRVHDDTVVILDNGAKLIRRDMETLARFEQVSQKVVDMWDEVLNYEEKYRNRDSMRRYFFTTVVMEDPNLHTPFTDFNTQYDIFSCGLLRSAHFDTELLKMRSMDLVFFPIFNDGTYYLVVKSPSIVVLDNRFSRGMYVDDTLGSYEESVEILHMKSVIHPVVDDFTEIVHTRPEMVWQMKNQNDDSGVFLMRHMETWMGEERSWKTGLTYEGPSQKTQVIDLRKKYTAKLAVTTINNKRDEIMANVEKFNNIEPKVKTMLIAEAAKRRDVCK